jgi:hypothetical protein
MVDDDGALERARDTPDAVRERLETAIGRAAAAAARSSGAGGRARNIMRSLADRVDRRKRAHVEMVVRFVGLLERTERYDRRSRRLVRLRCAMLRIAIFYYEYRWIVLKLMILCGAAYLIDHNWNRIVDFSRDVAEFTQAWLESLTVAPTAGGWSGGLNLDRGAGPQ